MNSSLLRIFLITSLLMGCAQAKPFDYHSGTEIPKGPGLFSKEKGEFTVYSSEKDTSIAQEKAAAPAVSAAAAGAGGSLAPDPAVSSNAKAVDNGEQFHQLNQTQAEQKEFEAFQQWKNSPQNAEEYKEFQEWKRWKAYQQWQESQQSTK